MTSSDLRRGLYEALMTEGLREELDHLSERLFVDEGVTDSAESVDRLALHLGQVVQKALADVPPKDRRAKGVNLVRQLIAAIEASVPAANVAPDQLIDTQELKFLRGLFEFLPTGQPQKIPQPLTPLLDTTLLTNARAEPRIGEQIKTEIASADRVDVVMAFVRMSGIRKFLERLRQFCERDDGTRLRILTTTYTNSTELKALEVLRDIGAEIKVSYDTSLSRLHAKAWYFHRRSGASTAYIGSSNLTHSAQETGMEWNVRVSGIRNPDVVRKVESVFETYWESGEFEHFDVATFNERTRQARREDSQIIIGPLELRLEPFQSRLLEQIDVARSQGRTRNLLVSATGTGKTVMAAADYARLRKTLDRSRLLFVAHRQEILKQSRATFAQVLKDGAFGELWVSDTKPVEFDHVFASVQSLARVDLTQLAAEHFDIVVIDEFHHAAASTYDRLLQHLKPKQLLGLTATPERADGQSILEYFDGHIAAELRLWDAIDQHRLAPFAYYGIYDGLNLSEIPWRRGQGYDVDALSNLYTANDVWARQVIKRTQEYVDDITTVRGLGFCVSVSHAEFMALQFTNAGLPSVAVSGNTAGQSRAAALQQLNNGEIRFVFSVDIFNEGVDIPSVDTLLLLRPTESATLFLQQLGRGLRRSADKAFCTVLDFVGQHRREFRFDKRLRALLGGSRKDVMRQVENGFPFLPAGCHMELDRVAQKVILESLKNALPSRWPALVSELQSLMRDGVEPTLDRFLEEAGLELEDVYGGSTNRGWSDLLQDAGGYIEMEGPVEKTLRRAIGRLLHIDDMERIQHYRDWVSREKPPALDTLAPRQLRLMRMLVASLCEKAAPVDATLNEGVTLLWRHPQVLKELGELLYVLQGRVSHSHIDYDPMSNNPLQIHARYSRIEILAAFGEGELLATPAWREGVRWSKPNQTDLLAFTLKKNADHFSPTTMYRDYAISRDLLHWESQSNTSAASPTGLRYQNHMTMGTSAALFARETPSDRAFWCLGKADYVSHQSERPMAITWQLREPLPGDLYGIFVAAVA